MEDSKQDIFLDSFTSVAESYYTYTSPNASAGPSPTFSRKLSQTFNVTNNLSIVNSGAPSLSGFSLELTARDSEPSEEVEEDITPTTVVSVETTAKDDQGSFTTESGATIQEDGCQDKTTRVQEVTTESMTTLNVDEEIQDQGENSTTLSTIENRS